MIIKYDKIQLKEKVLFGRVKAQPPTKNCASTTPEEAYLFHVKEGECWVFAEQERIFLNKQQSIFLKGAYVGHLLPDKESGQFEAVSIRLHTSILKDLYKDKLPFQTNRSKKINLPSATKLQLNELVNRFFDSMIYYFDHPHLVQDEILKIKLREAIFIMLQTENATKIKQILQNLFSGDIHSFQQIVESHIFSDLTISELAHLSNRSLSSFKRQFKKIFKTTPVVYFQTKRLEKAKHLLQYSDLSISAIAFECAFKTPSHFAKKFKDYYKISPSDMKLTLLEQ